MAFSQSKRFGSKLTVYQEKPTGPLRCSEPAGYCSYSHSATEILSILYSAALYYFYSMGANGIVNAFYAIDIILRQLRRDEPNYNDKFFDPNRLN